MEKNKKIAFFDNEVAMRHWLENELKDLEYEQSHYKSNSKEDTKIVLIFLSFMVAIFFLK